MLLRFAGGPRDGQTIVRPDDQAPPDVATFEYSGWMHTYRRDREAESPTAPGLRIYQHDPMHTHPVDSGELNERPGDARERLRRTASEPWPPSGRVGPGDVPGGRLSGGE